MTLPLQISRAARHGAPGISLGAMALLVLGCAGGDYERDGGAAGRTALALAAVEFEGAPSSGMPHLVSAGAGRVLMSWLEPTGPDNWALRISARLDGAWTEPHTVIEQDAFFVNWADFPSVAVLEDGTLLAHWLQKVADDSYAYHVFLSLSGDGGETWSEPVRVHDDQRPTEHGFVSIVPWEGGAALVWLDGREMNLEATNPQNAVAADRPPDYGAMTLRARTISSDGALGEEWLLDERTCECCTTSLVRTGNGLVAAYRDRSAEEIRDIYITRFENGEWSAPVPMHDDGWEIPGCPVNGPQLAADGDRVAIAWFTAADDIPRVFVAFSEDGGRTWGEPVRVDEGRPLGRVDVELLADGSAAITWVETAAELPQILLRRIGANGDLEPALEITATSAARASGFPRMALVGSELLIAWTVPGPDGGVRVRSVKVQ